MSMLPQDSSFYTAPISCVYEGHWIDLRTEQSLAAELLEDELDGPVTVLSAYNREPTASDIHSAYASYEAGPGDGSTNEGMTLILHHPSTKKKFVVYFSDDQCEVSISDFEELEEYQGEIEEDYA